MPLLVTSLLKSLKGVIILSILTILHRNPDAHLVSGPVNMQLSFGIVASFLALASTAHTDKKIYSRQRNGTEYKVGYTPLKTDWTDTVGTNPWPEYPRPRLQRPDWKNLNGRIASVWTDTRESCSSPLLSRECSFRSVRSGFLLGTVLTLPRCDR